MASASQPDPARLGALLGALIGPSAFGVTAATVAIPAAAAGLDSTPVALAWPLTAYIALLALSSAIAARLIAVFGAAPVLTGGSLVTAAGAAMTLDAPSLAAITISRGALGIGAGALAAVALALAGAAADGARPRVLGALAGVMAASIGLGPLLGAALTQWSWRAALALPVVALLAAPLVAARARASRPREGATVDAPGALLLSLAAGGLIVGLQAAATGVPETVLALLLAIAGVSGVALVRRVVARPDGFLPRAIAGRRELAPWWIAALGAQAGQVAALVVVPQLLAVQHGWSTWTTGIVLAALSLAGVLASRGAAARAASPAGVQLAAVAMGLLTVALALVPVLDARAWLLLVVAALGFAALSALQVVALHHVSAGVPDRLVAVATGIVSLVLLIGGAAGSAVTSLAAGSVGFAGAAAVAAALPLLGAISAALMARRSPLAAIA